MIVSDPPPLESNERNLKSAIDLRKRLSPTLPQPSKRTQNSDQVNQINTSNHVSAKNHLEIDTTRPTKTITPNELKVIKHVNSNKEGKKKTTTNEPLQKPHDLDKEKEEFEYAQINSLLKNLHFGRLQRKNSIQLPNKSVEANRN